MVEGDTQTDKRLIGYNRLGEKLKWIRKQGMDEETR